MANCTCIKTEVGQGFGGVKGHIVTSECEECRVKREESNVIAEAQRAEQKVAQEKETQLQAKIRELGEEALKKDI